MIERVIDENPDWVVVDLGEQGVFVGPECYAEALFNIRDAAVEPIDELLYRLEVAFDG